MIDSHAHGRFTLWLLAATLGMSCHKDHHLAEHVGSYCWLLESDVKRAAAAFDPPPLRAELRAIDAVRVVHHPASAVSALLLVGWLASRLGWSPRPLQADAAGLSALVGAQDRPVRIELSNDPHRPVSELVLTVEMSSGRSLSFARGVGGAGRDFP